MISASQAVQSLNTASSSSSVQLSRTALIAAALPPATSVVVSLGKALNEPVLYTASGLLSTASSIESVASTANSNTPVEPTSGTSPRLATTASVVPVSVASASGQPAAAGSTETVVNMATPMAADTILQAEAKLQADLVVEPTLGGMASALNVNAAIYRARPLSSASLVSAIEVPGPVSMLNAINVDIANLDQNTSDNQRRWTARS